jgi:hypothetical protein
MKVDTIECINTCQGISLILWYRKSNFTICYSAFRKEGQNWVFSLKTLRFNHFWTMITFCFKFGGKWGVPDILQFLYSNFYFFFTHACAMALWLHMSLSLAQICDSLYMQNLPSNFSYSYGIASYLGCIRKCLLVDGGGVLILGPLSLSCF